MMHTQARKFILWGSFICAYVVLDWASYLHSMHGLNITPWNPALALGLAVSVKYGKRTARPWFIALLLGDILIRGLPAPLLNTLLQSACLAYCYVTIAEMIRLNFNVVGGLSNPHNFFSWLIVVILGTFLTSCVYMILLFMTGLIPVEEWRPMVLRYWIGDCVGAIVTMPFFWILIEQRSRFLRTLRRLETVGYVILVMLMLAIAFGRWEADDFKYFHLLFLPLVWAAAVQGLAGVAIAAFVLQAGIIIAVQWLKLVDFVVFEMQLMGAILASVGFFIGVLIDERQRINAELRQTLRLAAAGEMAAALAHEINQPLTALSAYGMASEQLLERGETGERLRETIRRMVSESYRAAEVVRRLRDFFRTGATQIETLNLCDLLETATRPFQAKAEQKGIDLHVSPAPEVKLLADRLQLEVVFRNLLSNAFEALSEPGNTREMRRVTVSAVLEGEKKVCIAFVDSGPGLSGAAARRVFEAFHSTKSSGLGLGLAISRAIAEAHGGELIAEVADHGVFKLILPLEEKVDDAN